ncbi:hypothetical protein [Phytopseudomonas dryadis]|uniref:Uncharacterized protein n=1 Tax=Phytopseudomonas dryadis TaxID=2487520 RepID=A0A4Q9QTT6_9GAMM|nr:hypothetical protein [Pseudomonas dryadis]TBU86517.1 hypothetical protein DNK44_22965 [Pseudomonas dryadis]
MNEQLRALSARISKMESAEAADWLMHEYPIESASYGEALLLLPHRSWKRNDQKRLAKYYFEKLPFASSRGYEAFTAFMSVRLMLDCMRDCLPKQKDQIDLLLYNAIPPLRRAAKNDADRQLIGEFEKEIRAVF